MDSGLLVGNEGQAVGGSVRRRASVMLAGAVVVAMAALLLLQHRADAAQVAQIDVAALIRAIVCPILNALSSGPFASFFGGIFNALRAAFGCGAISG